MEKTKKKKTGLVLLVLLLCALFFAAGFVVSSVYTAYLRAQEPPSCNIEGHIPAGAVELRVNAGTVEWFDGLHWNPVSSAEDLAAQDRFQLAREDYRNFEEQLIARLDGDAESAETEEGEASEEDEEADGETALTRVTLPQTGHKAAVYTGGGGGGGAPAGGGGGAPAGGNDGQNMEWSGDYF